MKIKYNAQSMIELAVFGSVLIFLIGSIASTYLSGSFQQGAQIYAMRKALLASYLASRQQNIARLSASFMVFEDRLAGDFGKFGTMDRQPVAAAGSGMLSQLSMLPIDWNEPNSNALIDLMVNGKAFVFRSSAWVRYYSFLKVNPGWLPDMYAANPDHAQIIKIRVATAADLQGPLVAHCPDDPDGYPGPECTPNEPDACWTQVQCSGTHCPGPNGGSPCVNGYCYQLSDCPSGYHEQYTEESLISTGVNACLNDRTKPPSGIIVSCDAGTDDQRRRLVFEWTKAIEAHNGGYTNGKRPYLYVRIPRNSKDPIFGADMGDPVKVRQEWDYTRNGVYTDDMPDTCLPGQPFCKANSMWRWHLTAQPDAAELISTEDGAYPPYDVNADLNEESVYALQDVTNPYCANTTRCYCAHTTSGCIGAAFAASVLDTGAGDVNLNKTYRDYPKDPDAHLKVPGIRPNMRIYGRTTCVNTANIPGGNNCENQDVMTYLNIQEGKAYSVNGNQPLSISEAKKNQYDVIERIYQLNPDMADLEGFWQNNYKDSALSLKSIESGCTGSPDMDPEHSCCMAAERIEQTCLDRTTKTVYIRSRLSDKRGHKWTTATSRTWNQSLGGQDAIVP